jgi:Bacterial Ig-like domain (group 3)/FG-GAP-like repeat
MRSHTQQLRPSINCKRALKTHVLNVVSLIITIFAILIALVAPAQLTGRSQSPAKLPVEPTSSPLFLPAVTYRSGGGGAQSLAVADMNGDGVPDLAVANNYPSTLGILLGNSDGTFQAAVTYGSGGYGAGSVVVADVNGDGKPDLLVANACTHPFDNCVNFSDGSVGVLLGNGDGTFRPAATYNSGSYTISVAVADVDLDGKPDLVVANFNNSIAVLLGNGDGTFRPGATYSSPGAFRVSIADVNGDGKPDLLVANLYNNVAVLLGNGDGTFQPAAVYNPGGFDASSVIARDVNGDGKPDLLVTNWFVNNHNTTADGVIGVLLGNGDGTFQPAVTYDSGGHSPSSIAVADVNGDGKLDLAVENCSPRGGSANCSGNGGVAVLLGNGDGTFQPAAIYSSGGSMPQSIAIADVNGDGKPDLLVVNICASSCPDASGSVGVLLNKPTTNTALTSSLNPSIYGQKVTWTATVTSSGSITPTGKVQFTWSGYTIGSATLNSSGVATLTKSNLNADSYPLTAVYSGDVNNLRSTSAIVNQVVTETTSAAKITSTPNPSTLGQAVTFTATITSPTVTPTGPVTFMVGTKILGTAQLSGGKAKFTISTLAVGSTKVTATYYGDSNIAKSSASVTQTVHQ